MTDILRTDRRDTLRAMGAYSGVIWGLAGLMMLACAALLPLWSLEPNLIRAFVLPAGILLVLGAGLWLACREHGDPALNLLDGGIIVVVGWVVCCLAGAWPFMDALGLDFTRAFFESVSGFTTTGLSVVDVETAPPAILLWRSMMQLAGGAGLAIIMLAALAGPSGAGLAGAEGRTDRLAPHVRKSAGLVLAIYSGYALIGSIGYWLAGMSWFDAVNHAFAAVSTGGFSTHSASISHWNSPALELVSLPLMFFGGLNFLTAHLLLTGRFKDVFRNSELRTFLVLFLIAVLVLTMFPQVEHASLWQRLRPALFEAMTALTTTGFNSVDYTGWRAVTVHLFLVLMIIGGGTGSTSGGLKQYRFLLLVSAVCWEIKRALLPRRAVFRPSVFMGQARQFIDDADLRRAGAFLVVYLAALGLGVGVLTAHGYPLADSLFEFASAQGTVGLSLGVTSANAPDPVLWAEILGMFLGRLEFFIVITSVARAWSLLRNTHRSS